MPQAILIDVNWGRSSPTSLPTDAPSPRWSPSLLPGSLRLVRLLSIATMRPLRLPLPLPRSLRFPSLAESFPALRVALARAAESTAPAPGRWSAGVVQIRRFREGSGRCSQLSRIPPCAFAPLSDSGRPPCTWPASHGGDDLLCARRYCPPYTEQEDPDDKQNFGIQ